VRSASTLHLLDIKLTPSRGPEGALQDVAKRPGNAGQLTSVQGLQSTLGIRGWGFSKANELFNGEGLAALLRPGALPSRCHIHGWPRPCIHNTYAHTLRPQYVEVIWHHTHMVVTTHPPTHREFSWLLPRQP
jgi:hypothetical protein